MKRRRIYSGAKIGANRARFFRGQVDKYTWMDVGSPYPPGGIIAAFLRAQMEETEVITRRRLTCGWTWSKCLHWCCSSERLTSQA